MRSRFAVLVLVLLLVATSGIARAAAPGGSTLAAAIGSEVSSWLVSARRSDAARAARVERLYAAGAGAPLWLSAPPPHQPTPRAEELRQRLQSSADKGLDPADYDVTGLSAGLADAAAGRSDAAAMARLDLRLTAALVDYLTHLAIGRIDPVSVQFHVRPAGRAAAIDRAASVAMLDGVAAAEAEVEPALEVYRRMLALLHQYRALAAAGEPGPLAPVGKRPGLVAGDAYAGAPALAERLARLGDLEPASAPDLHAGPYPLVYDERLAAGVRRFQARHGLLVDGVIGARTIEALSVPLSARVRQLELTIERLRWVPEPGPGPFIAVNIPDFRLWAVDRGTAQAPLTMRVIVGKAGTRSAVFVDTISAVEFNPYWNVPRSIASKELYPKLAGDPGWMARENMELIGGAGLTGSALRAALASGQARLRQRPGPANALGRVKFVMPNRFSIYLHDTPSRVLFERSRRDFSYGCIRLEAPTALAGFALGSDPAWTPEAIGAAIGSGVNRSVTLRRPIPVLIFYSTVHAEPDGSARFVPDIYGHDARLAAALRQRGRP